MKKPIVTIMNKFYEELQPFSRNEATENLIPQNYYLGGIKNKYGTNNIQTTH